MEKSVKEYRKAVEQAEKELEAKLIELREQALAQEAAEIKPYELTPMEITKASRALNKAIAELIRENPDLKGEEYENAVKGLEEWKHYEKMLAAAEANPGFDTQKLYDIGREIFSFGQVTTPTFNRLDVEAQYEQQKAIAMATYLNDVEKLKDYYDKGWFGEGDAGVSAYDDALNVVRMQNEIETAVKTGDLDLLAKLNKEGAFTDPADYQRLEAYIKEGGRELAPVTNADILAVENAFGTKTEYVDKVMEAQPSLGYLAKEFGIGLVPVWGTVHHWDKMGTGMKAASIVADILFIVPVGIGVSAASKLATRTGTSARIATGLKNL